MPFQSVQDAGTGRTGGAGMARLASWARSAESASGSSGFASVKTPLVMNSCTMSSTASVSEGMEPDWWMAMTMSFSVSTTESWPWPPSKRKAPGFRHIHI